MKYYKTKPTALRNLQSGKSFTRVLFRKFWNDKEVVTEALKQDPNLFWFAVKHNPGIEWDADFVTAFFMRLLETKWLTHNLSDIGAYLPPEITDSKEIALLVAGSGCEQFKHYFAPDLFMDMDIQRAYPVKRYYEDEDIQRAYQAPGVCQHTVSLLMERTDVLKDLVNACPDLYWKLPGELRRNREASVIICVRLGNFRHALGGLHNDEKFVYEVLMQSDEGMRKDIFRTCSYRIRKTVGSNDPVEYLERFVQAKHLEESLAKKPASATTARTMLKI
jgi:hypothetical protein